MNFKIQQTYPQAPQPLTSYNTLIYAHGIKSLILYGEQKHNSSVKAQQPKKKIAFKASKTQAPPLIDKISIFSLQNWEWTIQECKGKIPSTRVDFQVFMIGHCMILYGGKSGDKYLNDIHALNTQTWVWKKLFTFQGPPANCSSRMCQVNKTTLCLINNRELWILRTDDVKWQLASNQLPGSVWQKVDFEVPKKIIKIASFSQNQILAITPQKILRVNVFDKKIVKQIKFDGSILQTKQPLHICEMFDQKIILFFNDMINLFMLDHKQEFLPSPEIQLPGDLHCATAIFQKKTHVIYLMDKKGELFSIRIDAQTGSDEQIPQTTRIIDNSHREQNPIITEQEDGQYDSSSFIQNQSRIQQISNNSESEIKTTFQPQKIPNQNFKLRTHPQSEIMIQDDSKIQDRDSQQLKNKLEVILTHEHIKRRLLQQKIVGLENIIKKSQKFVLMLCRYGNPHQKKRHIQEVKCIRQDLEYNLSKENYYRKQMLNNNIDISKIVSKVDGMIDNIFS